MGPGTCGGKKNCIHNFNLKTNWVETIWGPKRKWEVYGNNKLFLVKKIKRICTEFKLLRIRSTCGVGEVYFGSVTIGNLKIS